MAAAHEPLPGCSCREISSAWRALLWRDRPLSPDVVGRSTWWSGGL